MRCAVVALVLGIACKSAGTAVLADADTANADTALETGAVGKDAAVGEDADAGGATDGAGGSFDGAAPDDAAGPYVYVSGYDPTIVVFQLNTSNGALMKVGTAKSGIASPSYLAISPDTKYLYAINEASGADSKVVAFSIHAVDGSLQKINEAATGGDGAPHLSVHPGGQWVMVAHYGSGDVATLKVDATTGGVAAAANTQRPAASKSHQIISDVTGRYAFVPNLTANTIFQFKIDVTSGALTGNGSVTGFPDGAAPRHMAFHPSRPWAYSINETADTVSSMTYDPATGTLSDPRTIASLPAGAKLAGASGAHILVHPSGNFVYASNRGHDSISIFGVDQDTGQLTLIDNETRGGIRTPRDFGMDASGKFLIVANQDSRSVTVFQIDPGTGKLTVKGNAMTSANPTFVGIWSLR